MSTKGLKIWSDTVNMPGAAAYSQHRTWLQKGLYAVLDQGLISGSNFLLTILLARWLAPEQYGAYALSFAIFVFFSFFSNKAYTWSP